MATLPSNYRTSEARAELEARYDDCFDSAILGELMNLPAPKSRVSAN
jgi:hypothetical protein